MGRYQRERGKRGERCLAQKLREVMGWHGARRSVQYCGDAGDSDVTVPEVPGLFLESKLVEKLNVQAAMDVAIRQAGERVPVLCHRRSRTEWLVTLPLRCLPEFERILAAARTMSGPPEQEGEA